LNTAAAALKVASVKTVTMSPSFKMTWKPGGAEKEGSSPRSHAVILKRRRWLFHVRCYQRRVHQARPVSI